MSFYQRKDAKIMRKTTVTVTTIAPTNHGCRILPKQMWFEMRWNVVDNEYDNREEFV